MEFAHTSVLLDECISGLNIQGDGIYVDGTLGGAGHSIKICKKLNSKGLLIGIDQDIQAITAAKKRLAEYENNVKLVNSNFSAYSKILSDLGIEKVDGILLDLGVSSHQLDTPDRGFSYMKDAPLDMRMDQSASITAKDIVNGYSEKELIRILQIYGEERFATSITRNIIKARSVKPIETTLELVEIISQSIPNKYKLTGGHPAKRTFQAIRIELNRELEVLEETLQDMIDSLNENGRICIITFHSLEDRIVKEIFRNNEDVCICPKDFPVCTCNRVPKGKVITRKPILPTKEEIESNSRSKSAKLRIFQKGRNHE